MYYDGQVRGDHVENGIESVCNDDYQNLLRDMG